MISECYSGLAATAKPSSTFDYVNNVDEGNNYVNNVNFLHGLHHRLKSANIKYLPYNNVPVDSNTEKAARNFDPLDSKTVQRTVQMAQSSHFGCNACQPYIPCTPTC